MIYVIKKDGTREKFNVEKIITSVRVCGCCRIELLQFKDGRDEIGVFYCYTRCPGGCW